MRRARSDSRQGTLPGIEPDNAGAATAPAGHIGDAHVAAPPANLQDGVDEPWQMSLQQWLAAPRSWQCAPRLLTLNEWRSRHGYLNPLSEHGDFRHPHGINKITRRRIDARFAQRLASMVEGAQAYEAALAAGAVPHVIEQRRLDADGTDSASQLAAARVHHRRSVWRAHRAGLPVPPAILAFYGLTASAPA